MTADDFVAKLREKVPPIDMLRSQGYPDQVLSSTRATYLLDRRRQPQRLDYDLGEIGELIERYDLSQFNFCQVTFLPRPYIDAGAIAFGQEEADPLVMDPATREIRLQELGTNGFVLAECAKSPEPFLDAMFEVAAFMARPLAQRERPGQIRAAINRAAAAAGGKRYEGFYDNILGGYRDP